jgi:type VII secretion-associated serine protease mycosin
MVIRRVLRAVSGAALAGSLLFASAPHVAADQVRDDQWALDSLQAQSVWQVTKGKGQVVAVIDDGVNAQHVDLKGNVLKGKDFIDGGSATPENGDEHGTGMASIIAAHGHGPRGRDGVIGLAPEAKILPIRDQGQRSDGYAASIRYAVDHGATVINISQKQDGPPTDQTVEEKAIGYALKNNVVIVAGTGNDGGPVGYPAAFPGVVAVTGTDQSGEFWDGSSHGKETLLSAPAVKIVSAGNADDYRMATGTSDATAYTSAAVALLRSEFPDLTAGQIVNRLTKTAAVPASVEKNTLPDDRYGYGMIRPLAALTADIAQGSKWGPLSVPTSAKEETAQKQRLEESQKMQAQADRKAVIIWSVIGVVVLTVIAVVVFLIINSRRRKNRNGGPGGSAAPGGYSASYPPHQVPGYGYPPHQQQPMPPQHSAPPQQPPYN